MTTITPQTACMLIGDSATMDRMWCVAEHYTPADDPAQPPVLIWVTACKLSDAFKLDIARQNSEWSKLNAVPRPVMIRIIATGEDRHEIQRHCVHHIKSMNPMPRCNLFGYNMHGSSRPLLCSNGQTYRNQTEAAEALGLEQSHISRHLRGHLNSVKGYTFAYATAPHVDLDKGTG